MGKRLEGESFENYRKRLKEEAKELKAKLKGELVWVSSVITSKPEDGDVPEEIRNFYKVKAQGTYKKEGGK